MAWSNTTRRSRAQIADSSVLTSLSEVVCNDRSAWARDGASPCPDPLNVMGKIIHPHAFAHRSTAANAGNVDARGRKVQGSGCKRGEKSPCTFRRQVRTAVPGPDCPIGGGRHSKIFEESKPEAIHKHEFEATDGPRGRRRR